MSDDIRKPGDTLCQQSEVEEGGTRVDLDVYAPFNGYTRLHEERLLDEIQHQYEMHASHGVTTPVPYTREICRKTLEKSKTAALPATSCRVYYETGELICDHAHRAPRNLDCRLPYCLHRDEMRKRLKVRQSRALAKVLAGQS